MRPLAATVLIILLAGCGERSPAIPDQELPTGRIALVETGWGIVLNNLAGTERRSLVRGVAAGPDWSPAGDRIVYNYLQTLAVMDTLYTHSYVTEGGWGVYSADGHWIYFEVPQGDGFDLYRIHPDGTGAESVQATACCAAPSPDGTRLAYVDLEAEMLRVLDLTTRTSTPVASAPTDGLARWSPDGQWIAVSDVVSGFLVHPDGSGKRALPGSVGVAWSPDSRWLLAGNSPRELGVQMKLIDVATGATRSLALSGVEPAWRR